MTATAVATRELLLVEAVNDALHVELARDETVMVLGEDVGRLGGVFRATAGLRDRFGADRCVDTPLSEAGILGAAVGLCMAGWRPVVEMQYDAFSYPCLDQLITHVGRYRWRTGGRMGFPLVVRMPYGGGVRAPELHDDSPETYYVHTPGVKVAVPATPADAKGLLAAAIRDPDPVVVLEPKLVYRTARGPVPEGEHVVELGHARVARAGTDVTLVAWGAMVDVCERAAEALAGEASVEVLDLRTLKPLDEEALLAVRPPDRPLRRRPGGAADVRVRVRGRGAARRARDPRPPGPCAPRHRLRRAVPVLAARGLVHALGRACRRRRSPRARVLITLNVTACSCGPRSRGRCESDRVVRGRRPRRPPMRTGLEEVEAGLVVREVRRADVADRYALPRQLVQRRHARARGERASSARDRGM